MGDAGNYMSMIINQENKIRFMKVNTERGIIPITSV